MIRGIGYSGTQGLRYLGTQVIDDSFFVLCPASFKGSHPVLAYGKPIFWIVLTENLFDCLPDSIREPMRKEFKSNAELQIRDHEQWVEDARIKGHLKSDIDKNKKQDF